jgi:hypothetical protein
MTRQTRHDAPLPFNPASEPIQLTDATETAPHGDSDMSPRAKMLARQREQSPGKSLSAPTTNHVDLVPTPAPTMITRRAGETPREAMLRAQRAQSPSKQGGRQ